MAKIFAKNLSVISTTLDDKSVVLMDIETGQYYSFGHVASHIWNMLDGETSLEIIINKLLSTYNINYETCKAETSSFVESLLQQGLIKEI